jgi:hypothetical protein
VAKARQIHASCRAGQPVVGFASSASTIRQTERAQHRLIGTFANGVVIGRKANGESRFIQRVLAAVSNRLRPVTSKMAGGGRGTGVKLSLLRFQWLISDFMGGSAAFAISQRIRMSNIEKRDVD